MIQRIILKQYLFIVDLLSLLSSTPSKESCVSNRFRVCSKIQLTLRRYIPTSKILQRYFSDFQESLYESAFRFHEI